MTIYEKLNLARMQFQNKGIKQNGNNKFAGYSYFELSDILPACNAICAEVKASCVVRFETEMAYLDFIDSEKPEDYITFTSPMSQAQLKGCHAVQNLGAVETYIKRYLYQNCFEIAESDALDKTMQPNENQNTTQKPYQHTEDKELNKLKADVQNAINRGVIKGTGVAKAQWYMQQGNKEGLKNIIGYLVDQEIVKTQGEQ